MHSSEVSTLLGQAVAHHRAGRCREAELIYRDCIALDPRQADALHLLGVALRQQGRPAEAEPLIRGAISLCPCPAAELFNNLGNVLRDLSRSAESLAAFRHAVALAPANPVCLKNLGDALLSQGDADQATPCYQQAIALGLCDADLHNTMGFLLERRGQLPEAKRHLERAIELCADWAAPRSNLGNVLRTLGDSAGAARSYRAALALDPSGACIHTNLAALAAGDGRFGDAAAEYRRAIALDPDLASAHAGLAALLRLSGDSQAAIGEWRLALELQPDDNAVHSCLLQTQNLVGHLSPAEVFKEHQTWARRHARSSPHSRRFTADEPALRGITEKRRLHIGYVSGDFHSHAVIRCFREILRHHDPARFHVTCFSNERGGDAVTEELKSLAADWHEIASLDDGTAADLIQRCQIDLLVDLSGHTARNRLPLFARKPAPIQVTYFGYQDTTGLTAMDYRLTDADADPPGQTEAFHTESLWRLPRPCWCYAPTGTEPDPAEPPCGVDGAITFGCLNDLSKITPLMVDVWARILHEVQHSNLLLLGSEAEEGGASILTRLSAAGISRSRVRVLARAPYTHYTAYYQRIDIALDTFPYTGCTTTADAVYMGVPVVTKAGLKYINRQAVGLLKSVGLAELISDDDEGYLRNAVRLANSRQRLAKLRRGLRSRMIQSPLLDAPGLTRDIEAAYQAMVSSRRACEIPQPYIAVEV